MGHTFTDHLLARAQLRGGDPEGGVVWISFEPATVRGFSDADPLFDGHVLLHIRD